MNVLILVFCKKGLLIELKECVVVYEVMILLVVGEKLLCLNVD